MVVVNRLLDEIIKSFTLITWCSDASQNITSLIKNYTDSFVADGLLNEIIKQLDLTQELALLSENRVLGPPKHNNQVLDSYEKNRVQLTTILNCWVPHSGLSRKTISCKIHIG